MKDFKNDLIRMIIIHREAKKIKERISIVTSEEPDRTLSV